MPLESRICGAYSECHFFLSKKLGLTAVITKKTSLLFFGSSVMLSVNSDFVEKMWSVGFLFAATLVFSAHLIYKELSQAHFIWGGLFHNLKQAGTDLKTVTVAVNTYRIVAYELPFLSSYGVARDKDGFKLE